MLDACVWAIPPSPRCGSWLFDRPSRKQPTALGSYGRVPHASVFDAGSTAITWTALVWPTLLNASPMTILSKGDPSSAGIRLSLSENGLTGEVASASGPCRATAAGTLAKRTCANGPQ